MTTTAAKPSPISILFENLEAELRSYFLTNKSAVVGKAWGYNDCPIFNFFKSKDLPIEFVGGASLEFVNLEGSPKRLNVVITGCALVFQFVQMLDETYPSGASITGEQALDILEQVNGTLVG